MKTELLLSTERSIPAEAVRSLYDAVQWFPDRRTEDIADVVAKGLAIGAWEEGQLIGFARSISDGRFHAYIDDVVVHPDCQRRGIGSSLVLRLVSALTGVHEVTLFTGADNVAFYERLGFRLRESQRVLHVRHPS